MCVALWYPRAVIYQGASHRIIPCRCLPSLHSAPNPCLDRLQESDGCRRSNKDHPLTRLRGVCYNIMDWGAGARERMLKKGYESMIEYKNV